MSSLDHLPCCAEILLTRCFMYQLHGAGMQFVTKHADVMQR